MAWTERYVRADAVVAHRCKECRGVLFESSGPLAQAIEIRCRKCKVWNVFQPQQPKRPEAAGGKR